MKFLLIFFSVVTAFNDTTANGSDLATIPFMPNSNAILLNLEDCAICLEPLIQTYPFFFKCTHNSFHSACIYGQNATISTPAITSCPFCRAGMNPLSTFGTDSTVSIQNFALTTEITENEYAFAKLLLKERKFRSFKNFMFQKQCSDDQIAGFLSYLTSDISNSYSVLLQLKVKDWSSVYPVFLKLLDLKGISIVHLIIILRIGPLSPFHLK